jgi:hypothetical protein
MGMCVYIFTFLNTVTRVCYIHYLISLKIHMYVHSMHCITPTAVEKVGIFPSVDISHLYIRNETHVVLFINLLQNWGFQPF